MQSMWLVTVVCICERMAAGSMWLPLKAKTAAWVAVAMEVEVEDAIDRLTEQKAEVSWVSPQVVRV